MREIEYEEVWDNIETISERIEYCSEQNSYCHILTATLKNGMSLEEQYFAEPSGDGVYDKVNELRCRVAIRNRVREMLQFESLNTPEVKVDVDDPSAIRQFGFTTGAILRLVGTALQNPQTSFTVQTYNNGCGGEFYHKLRKFVKDNRLKHVIITRNERFVTVAYMYNRMGNEHSNTYISYTREMFERRIKTYDEVEQW